MFSPSRLLMDALTVISEWNFSYTDSVVLIRISNCKEWFHQGKFVLLLFAVHNSFRNTDTAYNLADQMKTI